MIIKDEFIGIKIYGYCNGYFGRDSYEDKTIIASGEDWVVAKTEGGYKEFASFDNMESMKLLIKEWSTNAEGSV